MTPTMIRESVERDIRCNERSEARQAYTARLLQTNPPAERARSLSYSKALVLRDAMREAARRGCTIQAQGILAILIAEAWYDESTARWNTRMSQHRLTTRCGKRSRNSTRAYIRELTLAELVVIQHGRLGRGVNSVSRYHITPPAPLSRTAPSVPLS